jgi:integrase
MAKKEARPPAPKIRGVYEYPKGSKIWWCQYFEHGKRHRERAGTRGNAIALYQKRKSAIRAGEKLPVLRHARTTFGELLDDVLYFTRKHHKSESDYVGKAKLTRKSFGALTAAALTPELIEKWIDARRVEDATFNRYKAFFSLCYKLGMRSGKVDANPATLIFHRAEPSGRKRYLSREEYVTVLGLIEKMFPLKIFGRGRMSQTNRVLAFVVSVFTGMRLSEQFTLEWRQVDFARSKIHLSKTKNGDDREIPMVSVVRQALLDERDRVRPKKGVPVFPKPRAGKGSYSVAWFERAIEEAAIDNYTWHNNRHTFCSWLALEGVQLKAIQELAGHKSITTTARYAHLCPTHLSTEAERMVTPKVAEMPGATKTATGS